MIITAEEFIDNKKQKINDSLAISMKDIGRKVKWNFIVEAASFLKCKDLEQKVFVFERLRILKPEKEVVFDIPWYEGKVEYRIGYYIVGQNGNKKNRWTWGQFCPMIGHEDLFNLLELAKAEKTILTSLTAKE